LSDETAIELEFGDGRYRFWLPMARIIEIERNCGDKSIVTMLDEMSAAMGWTAGDDPAPAFVGGGPVRIRDVAEVIRCGAIGGGLAPLDAKRLVESYVDGRPLSETAEVAWAILTAAVWGVRLKKKVEPAEPVKPTRRSAKGKSSPTADS
jgi:hypothetical protein